MLLMPDPLSYFDEYGSQSQLPIPSDLVLTLQIRRNVIARLSAISRLKLLEAWSKSFTPNGLVIG
jgi:hypothetical protein